MKEPELLDQVRDTLRLKHYSIRTETACIQWIKRYIYFHHKAHPRDLGEKEITAFLTDLAATKHVAASTQNQALAALLFLYQQVLGMQLEWMNDIVRAKKPKKLPVDMFREEVQRVLQLIDGINGLLARLMYGTVRVTRTRKSDRTHMLNRGGRGVKSPLDSVLS